MNIVIIVILLVAAVGAATSVWGPRGQAAWVAHRARRREEQERRESRRDEEQAAERARHHEAVERERRLVVERPADYARREGYRLGARLAAWEHQSAVHERELGRLDSEIDAMRVPWSGPALAVRLIALILMPLLFVLGLLLNLAIFTALDGSDVLSAGAFGKGAAITVVEMVLAATIAGLFRERGARSTAWTLKVWAVLAVLAISLAGVVTYAPARSEVKYAPLLRQDTITIDQLRAAQPPDQAALSAAQSKRDADLERQQADENSDRVMAVVLPLGQALCFEWALEGLGALLLWRRRRLRTQERDARRDAQDQLTREIATEKAQRSAQVVDTLVAAGVDPDRHLSAASRPNAGPQALGPTGAPDAADDADPDTVVIPPQRPTPEPPPAGAPSPDGFWLGGIRRQATSPSAEPRDLPGDDSPGDPYDLSARRR